MITPAKDIKMHGTEEMKLITEEKKPVAHPPAIREPAKDVNKHEQTVAVHCDMSWFFLLPILDAEKGFHPLKQTPLV